jgi:hypothetical protein
MQFWSVLVLAARTQQFLSYEMLEQMTNLPARAQSKVLGTIWTHCQEEGLPVLTSIVLAKDTGRPADAVLNAALPDLEAEQRRVFIYDWLTRGCPTLEELEAAEAKLKEWEAINA